MGDVINVCEIVAEIREGKSFRRNGHRCFDNAKMSSKNSGSSSGVGINGELVRIL